MMTSFSSEAIRGDDIDKVLLKWEPKAWRINRRIFARPETGHNERLASSLWASLLEEGGFNVQMPFQGMETSFFAVMGSGPQSMSSWWSTMPCPILATDAVIILVAP